MSSPSIHVLFANEQADPRPDLSPYGDLRVMTAAKDWMLHQMLAVEDSYRHVHRTLEALRKRLKSVNIHGIILREPMEMVPGMEYVPDNHPYWETHDDVWRTTAGIVTRSNSATGELSGMLGDINVCVVTDLHIDCRFHRINSILRMLNLVRCFRVQMKDALAWDALIVRVKAASETLRERMEDDGFSYIGFHDDEYTMVWRAESNGEAEPDARQYRQDDA